MSRPYHRLTSRGRNLLDAFTLLACISVCWTGVYVLPTLVHTHVSDPPASTLHAATAPLRHDGHQTVTDRHLFNPAARIDTSQTIDRTRAGTRSNISSTLRTLAGRP